jgi:hypothetical protein
VLYWYRTAPGIILGRPPLDEEAIHTIEDSHPDIDFDWPAILALSEVMTPEDEVAPARQKKRGRRERDETTSAPPAAADRMERMERIEPLAQSSAEPIDDPQAVGAMAPAPLPGFLEELVGREIATRLRSRYAEIQTLIYARETDPSARERRLEEALPLDPDGWTTPEAVLEGVRRADGLFERMRAELLS